MNTKNESTSVSIVVADPTPLGVFGLAVVTLVASSVKLGITSGVSLVIPWAFCLGATAQLIASLMDFKKGNLFGATILGGYALFWYSMVLVWFIQSGVFGTELATKTDNHQLGFAFVAYLIFSVFGTIAATNFHRTLFWIMVFIDFLFIGLAANAFGILPSISGVFAGISELLISILSFYMSMAIFLNGVFQKQVMPLGNYKK